MFITFFSRYKKVYKNFLSEPRTRNVLRKYKKVFDYLTEKTGKTVQTTGSVYYLYNLLKEEVKNYFILYNNIMEFDNIIE